MNDTNVSIPALDRLAGELDSLTPEARKAARYVLENPRNIGVSSVREIAAAAKVKPNTLVRMARQVGFEGYEDFREPFREAIRTGGTSFTDRARWLQDVGKQGELGELYADLARAALRNIEDTFAAIRIEDMRSAAETIWNARNVYTLGVGINNSTATHFTYLASTGMVQFFNIPKAGSLPADDLAWTDEQDVLIAITCKPYRTEVVEAVRIAREQGMRIIGISDSPASPIVIEADHAFILSTDTRQFFPSSVSTIAFLETLLSMVVAVADERIVARVETFHERRRERGVYFGED